MDILANFRRGCAWRLCQSDPCARKKAPKAPRFLGLSALQMAHLAGFEPTACRLGGGRSILLSYKCMHGNLHYTVFPRACQAVAHENRSRRTK